MATRTGASRATRCTSTIALLGDAASVHEGERATLPLAVAALVAAGLHGERHTLADAARCCPPGFRCELAAVIDRADVSQAGRRRTDPCVGPQGREDVPPGMDATLVVFRVFVDAEVLSA